MKLVTPNYSKRTPVVNDSHFSDAGAGPVASNPIQMPGLGDPQDSFNPGQASAPLPSGPPRFIQPKGAKRVYAKGVTNKRITQNI